MTTPPPRPRAIDRQPWRPGFLVGENGELTPPQHAMRYARLSAFVVHVLLRMRKPR